jgi:hypothetical protein
VLVQRLVEIVFAHPEAARAWLARIGLAVEPDETGKILAIYNPALKLRTALVYPGDPITRACCLGFATAGVHWPSLYPGLLEAVNAEWQRRRPVKPERAVRRFSQLLKHSRSGTTLKVEIRCDTSGAGP